MRFVRKISKVMRVVVKHCGNDWETAQKYCENNKDCELEFDDNEEIVVVKKFKQEIWT